MIHAAHSTRAHTGRRRARRTAASAALLALTLTACGSPTADQAPAAPDTAKTDTSETDTSETAAGHGAVAGAAEAAEPQLHLVTVDGGGAVGMLDLLSGEETQLGTVAPPTTAASDGRYVFTSHAGGVDIIDSAVWTWDHVDHFHYYRGTPALLGTLPGDGAATVVGGPLATSGTTGVFFTGSGEAILLENQSLADGTIKERFRVEASPHEGLIAPLGDGAVITEADNAGRVTNLRVLDSAGAPGKTRVSCPAASGAVVTRVALVIGCADGAVLATEEGGEPTLTPVALPAGGGAAPTEFAGRKGRPTVAGLGVNADGTASAGVWLLDTRARTWTWLASPAPLIRAIAVDDEAGHVVALDEAGRVVVLRADADPVVSDPLLSSEDLDPAVRARLTLTVDAQRAYLASPSSGTVFEIDFADGARVARELRPAVAPAVFAETGR